MFCLCVTTSYRAARANNSIAHAMDPLTKIKPVSGEKPNTRLTYNKHDIVQGSQGLSLHVCTQEGAQAHAD